jgi:hypothetical protein
MPVTGTFFGKEESFLEMDVRVQTERFPDPVDTVTLDPSKTTPAG